MAERIFHLTIAVTPELVGHRHLHRAARLDRPVKRGVAILNVKVERDAGAAAAFGRETPLATPWLILHAASVHTRWNLLSNPASALVSLSLRAFRSARGPGRDYV